MLGKSVSDSETETETAGEGTERGEGGGGLNMSSLIVSAYEILLCMYLILDGLMNAVSGSGGGGRG